MWHGGDVHPIWSHHLLCTLCWARCAAHTAVAAVIIRLNWIRGRTPSDSSMLTITSCWILSRAFDLHADIMCVQSSQAMCRASIVRCVWLRCQHCVRVLLTAQLHAQEGCASTFIPMELRGSAAVRVLRWTTPALHAGQSSECSPDQVLSVDNPCGFTASSVRGQQSRRL